MKLFAAVLLMFTITKSYSATAPRFQAETTKGDSYSLQEKLTSGRPVLVSFWATWCQPCLDELGQLKARVSAENSGVEIVAVNVDTSETSSDVRPTMRLHNIEFPVILDPTHRIFAKYNSVKAVPYSVLINPKGEIEATFSGYSEEMVKKLESYKKTEAKKETKSTTKNEKGNG